MLPTKTYSESTNAPTKHSPILGWVADGFRFTGLTVTAFPTTPSSGIRRMISGYVLRNGNSARTISPTLCAPSAAWAVRLYESTPPGRRSAALIRRPLHGRQGVSGRLTNSVTRRNISRADYDLDEYNGRWCVTPEFPNGTYAYFVASRQRHAGVSLQHRARLLRQPDRRLGHSISETVVTNFSADRSRAVAQFAHVKNGTVTLTWSATEGGTYMVQSTTNFSTWTTNSTTVAAVLNAASYTNNPTDNYRFYRVAQTALATYDHGWIHHQSLNANMNLALEKFLLFPLLLATGAGAADLRVDFLPQFNGAPLVFDSLANQTAGGQKISVTRLDFLTSAIALHRADGTWIEQKNWFGYIGARDGKTNFTLENIPAGNYDRVRFQIGLEPEINHGDAAQWPAGHPLNPEVNGLYWGWSKEYVFLALEGGWQNGGKQSGFSYHLATDRELMTVELPVALDLNSGRELQIALDVGKIFSAPNKIGLSDASDTTHSRTNDTLAVQLRQNIEAAFAVEGVREYSPIASLTQGTNHIEIAAECNAVSPDDFAIRTATGSAARQSAHRRRRRARQQIVFRPAAFGGQQLANRAPRAINPHRRFLRTTPLQPWRGRRHRHAQRDAAGKSRVEKLLLLGWPRGDVARTGLQPIQNPIEMHESLAGAVAKIAADKDYHRLFANAFGSPEITSDKIARALEQFLLVQVSFDSKFDRVMNGTAKFTDEETARLHELFNTEYDPYHGQFGADCFHCHGGPLLQSQSFANNGLDSAFRDLGRYKVTKRAGDKGKFAVPSLRNVAVTAPYMHDGRFRHWRSRGALLHRHETQSDARPEPRQASRRRRAVECRGQTRAGRVSENAHG
jgi:cytochrome c peroxidase